MEIFSYRTSLLSAALETIANTVTDKGLGKLVEIGNSGMFRPEMLESMGLP